jgi:hypothetical protein
MQKKEECSQKFRGLNKVKGYRLKLSNSDSIDRICCPG